MDLSLQSITYSKLAKGGAIVLVFPTSIVPNTGLILSKSYCQQHSRINMPNPNSHEDEYRGKPMIRIDDYGGYRRWSFGITNGKKSCRLVHCWDLLEEFVRTNGALPKKNHPFPLSNSFGEIVGYCVIVPGYTNSAINRYYDTPLFTLRGDEMGDTDPSPRADFQFGMTKAKALIYCKPEVDRIIRRHYSP